MESKASYTEARDDLEYYKTVLSKIKSTNDIEIKFIDSRKGRGVFAARDFAEGEVVLNELPLMAIQSTENKHEVFACSHCMKFIGSLEHQIELLIEANKSHANPDDEDEDEDQLGKEEEEEPEDNECEEEGPTYIQLLERLHITPTLSLPFKDKCFDKELPKPVACPNNCKREYYCSDQCAKTAWESYHKLLCVGPSPADDHPMLIFERHAIDMNDDFRLAARIVANICIEATNTGDFIKAWSKYTRLKSELWWALVPPEDEDSAEGWQADLKMRVHESITILRAAMPEQVEMYGELFQVESFGRIVGSIEMNSLETTVSSPISQYLSHLAEYNPQTYFKTIKPIMQQLNSEDEDYEFPPAKGTGLYAIHSLINHSCEPNAEAFKRDQDEDNSAVILVKKPIKKGEEVVLAYVDEELPVKDRKRLLYYPYLFECDCRKCTRDQFRNEKRKK